MARHQDSWDVAIRRVDMPDGLLPICGLIGMPRSGHEPPGARLQLATPRSDARSDATCRPGTGTKVSMISRNRT
jgi:hypothetical protein